MKTILVTGDVMVDHHIYEGQRLTASATDLPGVKVVRQHGGAMGVHDLIAEVIARDSKISSKVPDSEWSVGFGLTKPPVDAVPCGHHALAIWKPFPINRKPDSKDKTLIWRADLLMGYGHDDDAPPDAGIQTCPIYTPAVANPPPPSADVLVLDDAGFIFRHQAQEECWLLPLDKSHTPDWIILKMSGPVCQGDLWPRLKKEQGDRLIVVTSAHELRQECVRLTTGLSWERTVEELRDALRTSSVLQELASVPRHLVIMLSADGALWLDNTDKQPKARLVFDASGAEGTWAHRFEGKSFGYLSCMVAALARAVMHNVKSPALEPAIRAGLVAMRDLEESGHGKIPTDQPDGFPASRLAEVIVRGGGGSSVSRVPWTDAEWDLYATNPESAGDKHPWRIVEMSQCPFGKSKIPSLLGLATQVVLYGELAIQGLPRATFGDLLTADRLEIEALRTIEGLMDGYRTEKKPKKPLSIGVFGPPGAGKSFGVLQLANSIFGKEAWLEFNLSQFKDVGDLIGAFHQVRDKVLSGVTPVVFWDEFDSHKYEWLQYLLAPMQDGRFQEGQISHFVGKCVFIFAGATGYAYNEFGPARPGDKAFNDEAWKDYCLKKGPDFHSRLDAYYNVLGPNQRTICPLDNRAQPRQPDAKDVCTALRRALLIRALLKVPKGVALDFDPDLLQALLQTSEYTHGARSLYKLVTALRPSKESQAIRRSALLPPGQLAMHVRDPESFMAMLEQHVPYRQPAVIEAIAEGIHETWRELSVKEKWKMQPNYDMPYKDLGEVEKEENRAAARRIPDILALAGLKIENSDQQDEAGIADQLKHHLRRLAEAEHEGWMAHRKNNGWRYDKQRDDAKKLHHSLLDYAKLTEADQRKDHNSVGHFPEMLHRAGYRIIWE